MEIDCACGVAHTRRSRGDDNLSRFALAGPSLSINLSETLA